MGCGDEKLLKYLTQTFIAYCNAMICQQVTLSGDAEWPKVADAVIEAAVRAAVFNVVGQTASEVIAAFSPGPPPNRACHFHGTRLSSFLVSETWAD